MTHLRHEIHNGVLIGLGILCAGMGLKGFLFPSHFIDGGVTGVSMLLTTLFNIPLALSLFVINVPFLVLGYRALGFRFALRSTSAIGGLSLSLLIIEYPAVTQDALLTAIFGGFCLGAGIGLAMRGQAVLDGTEIAALLISKRTHLLNISDVILLVNSGIFAIAALSLGLDLAMYSVLTYLAASKTIAFLTHGIEQYNAVIITSEHSDLIQATILRHLDRGLTVYRGRGGRTQINHDILYCVVTRLEIGSVTTIALGIDPTAFIIVHPLAHVQGGILTKSGLH